MPYESFIGYERLVLMHENTRYHTATMLFLILIPLSMYGIRSKDVSDPTYFASNSSRGNSKFLFWYDAVHAGSFLSRRKEHSFFKY